MHGTGMDTTGTCYLCVHFVLVHQKEKQCGDQLQEFVNSFGCIVINKNEESTPWIDTTRPSMSRSRHERIREFTKFTCTSVYARLVRKEQLRQRFDGRVTKTRIVEGRTNKLEIDATTHFIVSFFD